MDFPKWIIIPAGFHAERNGDGIRITKPLGILPKTLKMLKPKVKEIGKGLFNILFRFEILPEEKSD